MKRPYLMLYVADWQSNPKLRCCTFAERGIWIEVMCILHDQDEYGLIRWPLKQIAQAVHTSLSSLRKLVDKEVLKGADPGSTCEALIYTPRSGRKDGPPVTLVEAQPGPIWYSSRMVRDEYLRRVRGDSDPSPDPSPKGGISAGKRFTPNPSPSHASPHPAGPSSSVSDPDPPSVSRDPSFLNLSGDPDFEGNKDTQPKNGCGETPSKTPEQVANFAIWNLGVEALKASGVTDKNARSFLGKQQQTYGRFATANAVVEALAQNAIAPLEYIVAVLRTGSGERVQKSRVDFSMDAVQRGIAEREARRGAVNG
jgi:hypothetical protein